MAQTSAARKRNTSQSRSRSGSRGRKSGALSGVSEIPEKLTKGSRSAWKSISGNPVLLYLGGSLAAGVLARFAYGYYKEHPEIGTFIRDNFSAVEDKLREYRSGSEDISEARH